MYRVLKPDSLCISFYGWGLVDEFFRAWRSAGFRPVGHIVWVKDYASRERFLRYRHEQAFVLAKGRPALPKKPLDDIQPWMYSGNEDHPTQKAVRILTPLIEAFTQREQLVLDPFAGSGSTLVAAPITGRRYLGIELEQKYCALAQERLSYLERNPVNPRADVAGVASASPSPRKDARRACSSSVPHRTRRQPNGDGLSRHKRPPPREARVPSIYSTIPSPFS